MTDECYLLPVSVEIIDCMPDISYTLQWPGRCPPHKLPPLLGGDLGPILYMAPWAYQSPYPRQYQDQLIHFSTVCSCDHQKPHYIGNSRLHHLLCMRACVLLCMRYMHARTHTFNGPLSRTTRLSWFYWSKRQWVAVASAGPYASLHLAPDR